jgi:ketosteroid isomerase-like protein
MNRRKVSLAITALFLLCTLSMAARSQTAESPAAQERAVDARSHAWIKAALDADADTFRTFATDDYIMLYVEPKTAQSPAHWVTKTRDQWVEEVRSGKVKYHSVVLERTQVHLDGDVAVFRGEYTEKGVRNGKEYSESGFFVETWVRRKGQWFALSSVFP